MNDPLAQISVHQIVGLLTIASFVGAITKKVKIPYTIALVIVGLVLSLFHFVTPFHLTEELVLFIFLPALLFEASWNLNIRYLKDTWKSIGLLATFGVLIAITIIGFSLHYALNIPLIVALLFGAVIAPTDPVSVIAIMKQLNLDHRLAALVEGESLFNDGTSVVVFKLLLAILVIYGVNFPQEKLLNYGGGGLLQFLGVVGGGCAIGMLIGYTLSKATNFFDDHLLELTFTTLAAYGSFIIAESIIVPGIVQHMHFSGVIATVTAGLVMGNYGRDFGMSASTQIVVSSFWEYAAFAMNSILFLLIGLEIQLTHLTSYWWPITLSIAVVTIARVVSIYSLSFLSNKTGFGKLPTVWQHVLATGGLKGALSMALIFSIPTELISNELRELLITMVFGTVVFTLIFQGFNIGNLLKWLKLGHQVDEKTLAYLSLKTKMGNLTVARQTLDLWLKKGEVTGATAEAIKEKMETESKIIEKEMTEIHLSDNQILEADIRTAEKQLLMIKKSNTKEMMANELIPTTVGNEILASIDQTIIEETT